MDVSFGARVVRPRSTQTASLNSEAYKAVEAAYTRHYDAAAIPALSTGGTDMAQMRSKNVQCLGIGPGVDVADEQKGFGAHADQERILENELYRFVHFQWDVVTDLAKAK